MHVHLQPTYRFKCIQELPFTLRQKNLALGVATISWSLSLIGTIWFFTRNLTCHLYRPFSQLPTGYGFGLYYIGMHNNPW